jgi:hypothetical protein
MMRPTHLVNANLKDGAFEDIQFVCEIIPISASQTVKIDTLPFFLNRIEKVQSSAFGHLLNINSGYI